MGLGWSKPGPIPGGVTALINKHLQFKKASSPGARPNPPLPPPRGSTPDRHAWERPGADAGRRPTAWPGAREPVPTLINAAFEREEAAEKWVSGLDFFSDSPSQAGSASILLSPLFPIPSPSTRIHARVALRGEQHSAVKTGPEVLLGRRDWSVPMYGLLKKLNPCGFGFCGRPICLPHSGENSRVAGGGSPGVDAAGSSCAGVEREDGGGGRAR